MNVPEPFVSDTPPPDYRPCAGLFILNRMGKVFMGRRINEETNETLGKLGDKPWQLPQGGIDPGETPAQAGMREMLEEIGTSKATLLGESRQWHCYDLPRDIASVKWGGKYRGQAQKWLALRFDGKDSDINIATAHPEFDDWKWLEIDAISALVVPFKRRVYSRITAEFRHFAQELRPTAQP